MNTKKFISTRKEMKMTQKEMATFLNVSYPTIQKWEQEERSPSLEETIRISKLLNIDFLVLSGQEPREKENLQKALGLIEQAINLIKKEI